MKPTPFSSWQRSLSASASVRIAAAAQRSEAVRGACLEGEAEEVERAGCSCRSPTRAVPAALAGSVASAIGGSAPCPRVGSPLRVSSGSWGGGAVGASGAGASSLSTAAATALSAFHVAAR